MLTIFVDAFSGTLDDAGAALKYLHHLTLVLLFMTLNSKLRVVASGNRLPPILSSTGKSILLNIGLMGFAIWSIVTFGASSVSAVSLADGKPYCIAKPKTAPFPEKFYGQGTQEFYGQIDSLIWLRGRNLATTASGHKVAEDKGFFALLTVRDGNYDKFWKWSFRSMAWKPALPDQWNQLIVRAWGGCKPINDFLSKQPIFSTASLFKLD